MLWPVPTQTVTTTVPITWHKLYLPLVAMGGLNAANGVSTTYYRFNGARVAMRTNNTVYWLHGDHLGSASLVTSITGTVVSELRYKPYGETRYSSGNTPTDKRFTSQEQQADIGLYSFGARFYDPGIGRFISADSIVPQAGNPQSLNRFSYGLNNPLKYLDPSGYDPLSPEWERDFKEKAGRQPEWYDRAIRLFLIAFPNEKKWSDFYDDKNQLISVEHLVEIFTTSPADRSWANLPSALNHLADTYTAPEKDMYAHDIAFLFAGLPSRFEMPAWRAATVGQVHQNVYLARSGLGQNYTGTSDADANVHHWAWAFLMGYVYGYRTASIVNEVREWDQGNRQSRGIDQSDRNMGDAGALIGGDFASASMTMNQASMLLLQHLPIVPWRLTK